ncbi:MAG: rRNA maturation RNase YbeY [Candidatus Saccharicenans sp.]|jgi:probable rRNA maturation factor|nr:rRNA maturation RNase YbeY [Candidatus Saccharicenans sp.]MDH7492959.1 rRNA maturation RNase YbeY [Candidatus Saccharicenans sp.]
MVVIINKLKTNPVPPARIKNLLSALCRRYRVPQAEVVLSFVGRRAMRSLNRRYRRRDKPTDVLSFTLGEKGPDGQLYLGDIIICPEVAARQARKQGHSLAREIEILVIHGFLHLLSFEHFRGMEEEEARVRPLLLKNYRAEKT